MPIVAPIAQSATEVLQIDRNTARVACHYEKKWLDLSLATVVFIAPRLKALVVRPPCLVADFLSGSNDAGL
jgi:hypothetical protein